jgi:UDP:flavonoid glycosyltransferase YjiC (YdhE family)
MRLVALTYGTEGDTRPVAALGRSLIDAGYEVTLLADGGTLGSARDLDVPHAALAGDIHGTLQSVSSTTSIAAGKNSLNVTAQALVGIANENADAWMRQVLDSAAGSDGLIVAGLAAFVGFSAAEKLGIPVIGAGMIPLTPTSAFPSPFLPPRSMPRWLNRFSYRLVSELLWRAFRKSDQCGAREGRVAVRAQNLVRSSHALRDLAEPVAATCRLAEQRLVIHHGGSGTTHSAARAGVPSVVLPFAADQFFWAEQLRQRGIAPATGSVHNVTAATLSRAILVARTAEMREQASAVGAKMRAEDGPGAAVGRVHALMES